MCLHSSLPLSALMSKGKHELPKAKTCRGRFTFVFRFLLFFQNDSTCFWFYKRNLINLIVTYIFKRYDKFCTDLKHLQRGEGGGR